MKNNEIESTKSNFQVEIKFPDIDFFKQYHNIVTGFLDDQRIDVDIRMYYYDRFYEVCNQYNQ